MKILLDECVPWPLRHLLVGHECMTTSYRGWGGFSNGELLGMAEAEFDLFITATRISAINKTLPGGGLEFWNSRQTTSAASKRQPH